MPKPLILMPMGPSPWASILVRVFDEVLSGAQLPLEHGVPFIMRGTPDARSNYCATIWMRKSDNQGENI
jgi:hypothetical protein